MTNSLIVGDKIYIRNSKLLKNESLLNKQGVVTRLLTIRGEIVGAYIDVKIMRKVKNFYIPVNSIEGVDKINKTRTLGILKSTIL